jgi:hypothetical protein
MSKDAPSNTDDVIDSRDVIDAIDDETVEGDELEALKALAKEAEGSPDWEHGETLIRDSYFESYAQELAEETGMVKGTESWPLNCIDWEEAADQLKQDYFSVDFDGVDYWIRS